MSEPRFSDYIREARGALIANKLRTALTLLGIVIGVASVVLMVTLGETARNTVTRSLQSMGTNLIIVLSGSANVAGVRAASGTLPTLTLADAADLRTLSQVHAVSAVVARNEQVIAAGHNANTTVMGVEEPYFKMTNSRLRDGEFLSDLDVRSAARRVILGGTTKENLFGDGNALGEEVRINRINFTVVGVLQAKGHNLSGQNEDDILLMPLTTAQRTLYSTLIPGTVQAIVVEASSQGTVASVERSVGAALRERHRLANGAPDDFSAKSVLALAETTENAARLLSVLLGSIASISLLVGGIGIMNVMLVGVAERTREIGIRIALGARERHILIQFLLESVVLSVAGGALGVVLALAVVAVARIGDIFPLDVSWRAVALAFGVASAIGVVFGLYPARRAARLDPLAALRHE